jgi:pimeloyl-ACP methyl ester carboxylesterase
MVTTSSITTVDGAAIAYDDRGDGKPLVLVHGITEARGMWDPVTDLLASQWRVVRVDLRGHGASDRRPPYDLATMAGDVAAVVDSLGFDRPLLVGHSLGGAVVSAYGGAGLPARGIVNVDQMLRLGEFQALLEPLVPMLQGDEAAFRSAVDMMFSVLEGPLPPAEHDRLRALSSPEQAVVLGVWAPLLEASAADLDALAGEILTGIRVPYLAIHGTDPGVEYVQWLLGHVGTGNARVEVWPDHGHYPQLIDPARFFERLDQFDGGL